MPRDRMERRAADQPIARKPATLVRQSPSYKRTAPGCFTCCRSSNRLPPIETDTVSCRFCGAVVTHVRAAPDRWNRRLEDDKQPIISSEIFCQPPRNMILTAEREAGKGLDDPVFVRFDLAAIWPNMQKT